MSGFDTSSLKHQRVSVDVIGGFAFNCPMRIITFWMRNLETISFTLEIAVENGGIFKASLIESCNQHKIFACKIFVKF
jgi:hypothetical protein